MNGLATRKALADITDHCAPGAEHVPLTEDEHYSFRHGRASAKLKPDPFTLPDRLFMPNIASLGTPGEAERSAANLRERLYARAFVVGGALIVALVALYGYGYAVRKPEPQPIRTGAQYHARARSLDPGQSLYLRSTAQEDCKVAMHKDARGQTVVAWHC